MVKSVSHRKQAPESVQSLCDEKLPGMNLMLNSEEIGSLFQKKLRAAANGLFDCEVEYIRYKPATNCLATYRIKFTPVDAGGPEESVIWGKAYTREDFSVAVAKLRSRGKRLAISLDEPIIAESAHLIFDDIANDHHLEGLQTILDPRKLRRILYDLVPAYPASEWRISHKRLSATVVRFKPEKRAVIRITTTATNLVSAEKRDLVLYLRCYCDDRGAGLFAVMKMLSETFPPSGQVVAPTPYAYLAQKRILIVAGVDGTELLDALHCGSHDEILTRVAGGLAQLHKANSSKLTTRVNADLVAEAKIASTALRTVLPAYAPTIDRLLESIVGGLRDTGNRVGFVHGDFHHGQVLIQSDKVVLLDFDRSYRGETIADVGNFCAHLRILEIENRLAGSAAVADRFISAYERASGLSIDRSVLRHWIALGVLLRAIHPFRTLQPQWHKQIAAILDLCAECLA